MSYSSHMLIINIAVVVCCALLPLIIAFAKPPSHSPVVIASHCSDKCGDVSIPYPFGIEEGCYFKEDNQVTYSSSFNIHCNHTTSPPTPIFGTNLEVLNISVTDAELRSKVYVSYDCYNETGYNVNYSWAELNLVSFTLSSTKNILVAIGCDTYSWFTGFRQGRKYETGCMTQCVQPEDVIDGECSGIGCCQAAIPTGVKNISVDVYSFHNHTNVSFFNPCSVAFPIAKDAFRFSPENLSLTLADIQGSREKIFENTTGSREKIFKNTTRVPVVFNWAIGTGNCSAAAAATANDSFLCKENAECYDPEHEVGYRCRCKQGFAGNPYLPHGCTDVDECKEGKHDCEKEEYCTNTAGGYYCKCPKRHHGHGTNSDRCISNRNPWLIPVLVTAGVGGAIIALLVIGFLLHWKQRERQLKKMRETCFQQNGGLLLYEKLSRRGVDTLKIFNTQDLEHASNNYCQENIIGRGGFGIVYKGILPNNQVVAIKKSLKVDPNQVEQFINEVFVLSQIKNKYVVKLLGCCLESEVPLLVYEFINNGTLYEHLNDGVRASFLKWHMRLKIASQVANVLSYLHNTISPPIIHRDMKSMNILLDESYTAKVTDFGASRLIPPDQSQFATLVLGTRGYLDPEYLQTSELNEKSDVYSFGVVLVELLTRKKAISNERPETEKCLAMHFLIKMKEGCLLNILDRSIVNEGTVEDIEQVANLAKCCLMLKGEDRPTMKEVALELETIIKKEAHPWNDDGSMREDHESLLDGVLRSDDGGGNSGIESNSYDSQLLSSLRSGR